MGARVRFPALPPRSSPLPVARESRLTPGVLFLFPVLSSEEKKALSAARAKAKGKGKGKAVVDASLGSYKKRCVSPSPFSACRLNSCRRRSLNWITLFVLFVCFTAHRANTKSAAEMRAVAAEKRMKKSQGQYSSLRQGSSDRSAEILFLPLDDFVCRSSHHV